MTDTVPAASTGLPSFDRRSFLATLAAAGVLTGAAAPAIAADDPDAMLVSMEADRRAAEARRDALDVETDAALDRLDVPPAPGALCWRKSDHLVICIDRARCCGQYGEGKDAQYVYEAKRFFEGTRERISAIEAVPPHQRIGQGRELARLREILEAHEAHEKRVQEAEDACGYTALSAAVDRETQTIVSLTEGIMRTPARTVAGMIAKASALGSFYADDVGDLEKRLPGLIGKVGPMDWRERREALAASLTHDLMRLGATVSATSCGRSAA